MDMKEAILSRRSIRRFLPKPVEDSVLLELVELARFYASGGNLQPIRFAIVSREPARSQLFAGLKWAMYLPQFSIREDQRSAAYIVLLRQGSKSCQFDLGAAATTVMLAAREKGLDTCCLASFSREDVKKLLGCDLEPELVIALGYADQESRAVEQQGDHRYFETADGALNVPKLGIREVLVYTDAQ